jgi:hypothetical protein
MEAAHRCRHVKLKRNANSVSVVGEMLEPDAEVIVMAYAC